MNKLIEVETRITVIFLGGAFSSARSAVSSWFTSITNDWKNEEDEEIKDNISDTHQHKTNPTYSDPDSNGDSEFVHEKSNGSDGVENNIESNVSESIPENR